VSISLPSLGRRVLLVLAVFVLLVSLLVVGATPLAIMAARYYGIDLRLDGLDLGFEGGVVKNLGLAGIDAQDVRWQWRDPALNIDQLRFVPSKDSPANQIDPGAIFDQLKQLNLPVGRIVINQFTAETMQGRLSFDSQSAKKFNLAIDNLAGTIAGVTVGGSLKIDWDGKNLACDGTIKAKFMTPIPVIGSAFTITPICQKAAVPLIGAWLYADQPDKNLNLWQQAKVTMPIATDAIDHIIIKLEKSPLWPPMSLRVAAKRDVKILSEPLAATMLGLPLTISPIELMWRGDHLRVQAVNINWDEGRIMLAPMEVDLAHQQVKSQVSLEKINLSLLLKQWPIDGLSIEGLFDGVLPFRYDQSVLTIIQGYLAAKKGIVRYRADPAAAASLTESGGGIALAALGDFHYDDLKIVLDGQQKNEQSVQMTLSGRNPALYDGYPVIMRVNLSGALENLLQQGQATLSLPERLKLERQKNQNGRKK
jgi:hypothetical protein